MYIVYTLCTVSVICLFVASSEVKIDVSVPVANENAKTPPIIRNMARILSEVLVALISP